MGILSSTVKIFEQSSIILFGIYSSIRKYYTPLFQSIIITL
ncbi:hypothetical protein CLOHYLEM_07469 [[Clostridium] hylemonae DSM 15053]|uniref:Uncharacterized protein n=1 Tax=[Clostridium] hylemonae DSM 15053 TaxID=553973 RepID=C0C5T2_9FIRM|nr:hypothetical protein CLOHYLEM_07469 [[Clostridium] hylemonae DSM 15053]